jgi:hypothetical protein
MQQQGPQTTAPIQGQTIANPASSQNQGISDLIGSNMQAPEYGKSISAGLAREWFNITKGSPQAGPADVHNPLFAQWSKGMLDGMRTNPSDATSAIDPQKIAPLLFNSKRQSEAYQSYAQAKQAALKVAIQASKATGLAGGNLSGVIPGTAGASAGRQQILSSMEKIGGKPAVTELKGFLNTHLMGVSAKDITAKIDELARKYNPDIDNALRSLGQ